MKLLIVYSTTDGQTRKIARFAADRFVQGGHSAELLAAADAQDIDIKRFDGILLAGSIHIGGYQKPLAEFARANAAVLNKAQTLFLSVSLSAAGSDKEDWAGIEKIARDFCKETGWKPGDISHVAGAFRFTEYDFFRAWAMRWIAVQKGQKIDPNGDREYTDWAALGVRLDAWVASLNA